MARADARAAARTHRPGFYFAGRRFGGTAENIIILYVEHVRTT
jgi:hypothetical protein